MLWQDNINLKHWNYNLQSKNCSANITFCRQRQKGSRRKLGKLPWSVSLTSRCWKGFRRFVVHTTSGQYSAAGWPYEKNLFISGRTLPKPFAVIVKNTVVITRWNIKTKLVEHWKPIIRGDIIKSVRAETKKKISEKQADKCVNNKNMKSEKFLRIK